MSAASSAHERRVGMLEAVAVLTGFHVPLVFLPDGTRPDVLRADLRTRGVFMGEAKHSETPHSAATAARLLTYFRWMAAARPSRALVAVCFARPRDRRAWAALLQAIAGEARLPVVPLQVPDLAFDALVVAAGMPVTRVVRADQTRAVVRDLSAAPPRLR